MKRTSFAVICLLFSSAVLGSFNSSFDHILQGEVEVSDEILDQMYDSFVNEFSSRPSAHYQAQNIDRKTLFKAKVNEIIRHNSDTTQTYQKGLNQFSDLTDEEFTDYYHLVGDNQECSATNRNTQELPELATLLKEIPSHWDWRDQGVVSPVKDQGKCGSCWTFSTVGAVESHYLMRYGQFKNLSEQQLVDCAQAYDNNGCSGGLPSHAFEYIKDNGGLTTEDVYPYRANDGQCALVQGSQVVGIKGGSVNITLREDDLQGALFANGPVSVAFQVASDFRDYKTGVYSSTICKNGAMDVNHAVLAVGYGNQDGMDYWVIKNSWSATWGDQGYFKMQRGVNMCGIVNCNSYPKEVYQINPPSVFLQ